MSDPDESQTECSREPRTNMFVMATIYAGSGSAPVKIRNLSTRGALIEGELIPPPETEISLQRGSLKISGVVVWRQNGRGGLLFRSRASVTHWLPGGESLLQQERVDAIFHGPKTSGDVMAVTAELPLCAVTALEIAGVQKQLQLLAEALSDDMDVVVRHGSQLQSLDLAVQVLEKLADKRGTGRRNSD